MENEPATGEAGSSVVDDIEAPSAPAVATAAPAPQDPNGIVVPLPCGYVHEGVLHKYAEFVPMSGGVRKAISKKSIRDDFVKVSDMVLRMCVKRMGSIETTSPKTLRWTTLADRDYLLMEIRRESMTDKLRAIITCQQCRKQIQVSFQLDEIEVVRLEKGDYEIVNDQLCFRVKSATHKIDALCRFPIGEDQDQVVDLVDNNPTDAQYRLYAACLLEWNGQTGPFGADFFDELLVNQIDEFTKQFVDKKPGPVFEQLVSCPNGACGSDIAFTFEGSDFFFPLPTRGRT